MDLNIQENLIKYFLDGKTEQEIENILKNELHVKDVNERMEYLRVGKIINSSTHALIEDKLMEELTSEIINNKEYRNEEDFLKLKSKLQEKIATLLVETKEKLERK
jgi:nicotinamide mononucleotide adenylyltransferase